MENVGKFALITGATSGIGYELAKIFARDRYNLVIVARDKEMLEQSASEFRQEGIDVIMVAKDLFRREAAFELYEEIKSKEITIDVLVNDAAQGQFGEFTENDLQRELDILQLNIASVVALTKLFLKDMVRRGEGKILNLSSIAGKIPGPYQAVYHATKAFIQSFTQAVRSEVKHTGVTLTSLLPGVTETDFFNKADMNASKIVQEGDMADPAKVAEDGYKALMDGEAMIISGWKNKMQVTMGNMIPDNKAADTMKKQQKPVPEKERH